MTDKIVPELVRYEPDIYRRRDETILCRMVDDTNGEYVRYDQAAAMLAAKDTLLSIAKQWARDQEERANRAEAELTQLKEQDPVGSLSDSNGVWWYSHGRTDGAILLYAAPVDQTAEIERLRDVAKKVIARWDSPHWKVTALTADVMNELRAALSGKETK